MFEALQSSFKLGRLWAVVQFDYQFSPSPGTRDHILPELQGIAGQYSLDELAVWVLILYSQTVDPRHPQAAPQFQRYKQSLARQIAQGKVQNRALIQRFSQELRKYGIDGADLLEDPFDLEVPLSGSLPDVTKSAPSRVFSSGHLVAMFLRDLRSIAENLGMPGVFEYPYVLVVVNTRTRKPILFVTYELSRLSRTSALCAFLPGGTRQNFGSDDRAISAEGFVQRALEVATSQLGVKFAETRG